MTPSKIKKILQIIVTPILICFSTISFFLCSSLKNIHETRAEDNLDLIGKLYNIQHVSQTTKVYVFGPLLNLAQEAGRTIYEEVNSPLNNSEEPESVGYVFMDDGYYDGTREFHPPVRYYYYANYYEPILTGSRLMYNDYESVAYALSYLESEAEYFNIQDINNAVLSYVRCIDSSYKNETFLGYEYYTIVCGNFNSTFVSQVKLITPGGMKINEYFASFIQSKGQNNPASNYYDSTIYGSCDSDYLMKEEKMANPTGQNSNHTIDLIHMFASLDGIFQDTGESTGTYPFNILSKNIYRHLVSWAGDLQGSTLICSIDEYLNPNMYLILASSHYGFDYCDYYADLDSINMAMGESLNNVESLAFLFANYYDCLEQNIIGRESSFVSKIASTSSVSFLNDYENFEYVVREMLGVDMDGNNIVVPVNLAHSAKYAFLSTGNLVLTGLAGLQYRNNMSERFVEYVLD